MNWFQKIAQNYEFQPIGAPFRRKVEMPPAVHRESKPPLNLRPSPFDIPFNDEIADPELYPEIAHQQQKKQDNAKEQLSILRESLTRHLTKSFRNHPDRYSYQEGDISVVVERFLRAMQTGQFHTSSESFKKMCKELGIKPTEKGVRDFIFKEHA